MSTNFSKNSLSYTDHISQLQNPIELIPLPSIQLIPPIHCKALFEYLFKLYKNSSFEFKLRSWYMINYRYINLNFQRHVSPQKSPRTQFTLKSLKIRPVWKRIPGTNSIKNFKPKKLEKNGSLIYSTHVMVTCIIL